MENAQVTSQTGGLWRPPAHRQAPGYWSWQGTHQAAVGTSAGQSCHPGGKQGTAHLEWDMSLTHQRNPHPGPAAPLRNEHLPVHENETPAVLLSSKPSASGRGSALASSPWSLCKAQGMPAHEGPAAGRSRPQGRSSAIAQGGPPRAPPEMSQTRRQSTSSSPSLGAQTQLKRVPGSLVDLLLPPPAGGGR